MRSIKETINALKNGEYDDKLTYLYSCDKNDVEKYVIKNGLKDMGMDSVDNIFKYVIPKTISVPKAKKRVVAIMCNFKFDMEHGMAIVFEDEKIKKIGPQDIVL